MKSYKGHLKPHPIYCNRGIHRTNRLDSAKQDMPSEMYNLFCAEVDTMLEKWALLYDIAIESPDAFNELDEKYNTKELFSELEKSVISNGGDKLTHAYIEAKKFIMYADDLYTKECNFSIRIQSLALGFAVCIDRAIDKKIRLKEANKKWERTYFSPQNSDNIGFKEPSNKRLKKADEKEEIDTTNSFGFS